MAGSTYIGGAHADFVAKTQKFTGPLDKARYSNRQFRRGIGDTKKSLFDLKGAMAVLPFAVTSAGLVAMAKKASNYASEVSSLSQVAGSNTTELQKNAAAAKTLNIETQKLADIYKDTNDKVGDFLENGAGPLKDFFENIAPKVGVTADKFRGLSGPQALQLYYNSLEKANLGQAQMTFYMEAIASDATALIPLLRNNGEEMKRLGNEAERTGQIMSDETIKALKEASDELKVFDNRVTVASGKAVTWFMQVGEAAGYLAASVAYGPDNMAAAIFEANDVTQKATTLFPRYETSIRKATKATNDAVISIDDLVKEFKRLNDLGDDIFGDWLGPEIDTSDISNETLNEAVSLTESLRTEQERYNDELKRAGQLLEIGLITQETYNRFKEKDPSKKKQEFEGYEFGGFDGMRNIDMPVITEDAGRKSKPVRYYDVAGRLLTGPQGERVVTGSMQEQQLTGKLKEDSAGSPELKAQSEMQKDISMIRGILEQLRNGLN